MLRLPLITAALMALVLPLDAQASSVIAFDRASARPNERARVVSRLSTPARLYVVRQEDAARVRSRTDRRLSFIGRVRANGSLTFSVPPLDAGTYRLVLWNGMLVMPAARLRIRSTPSCPVTRPNGARPSGQRPSPQWHGNGLLWAGLAADGVYRPTRDNVTADGSIFNKLPWVTAPPWNAPTISGERIDAAAPPLQVLSVNAGTSSDSSSPSYRSAVQFPTPGCWRLTGRVADVSLTYVVRVVKPS
ncbi:MAG: hypothetical protein ACRDNB_02335 [Gaiellaceae bacterium]